MVLLSTYTVAHGGSNIEQQVCAIYRHVNSFLALLDYFSRAHESKFVRRPSCVRAAIISEPNPRISIKFWLFLPLSHTLGLLFYVFFLIFNLIFGLYEYFSFSLTWDHMGTKISKRYSSYKSLPKVFKLFPNFLPSSPHKSTFGILEILKIEILTNFSRVR